MNVQQITITASDDYALQGRYWRACEAQALLVVVHGVISHSLWFEPVAQPLTRQSVSVLAVDRRGSGLNQTDRGDMASIHQMLADLDDVMRWAGGLQLPIHLCGFCWGANVVINYLHELTQAPGPITTVLVTPAMFSSEIIKSQTLVTGSSSVATELPLTPIDQFTNGPFYESFIKPDDLRLRKVSPRFNACVQQLARVTWKQLLQLDIPVMVLLAENDTLVDNELTQSMFHRVVAQRKSLFTLAGAHGLQFDQPQAVANHISNWIAAS